MGDDLCLSPAGREPGREQLRDGTGRRARIEVEGAAEAIAERVECSGGDAQLGVGAQPASLDHGGLRCAGAIDGDGAAVHPAQGSGELECIEVAAHGLGRDAEAFGELDHGDAAFIEEEPFDQLLTLHRIHLAPPLEFQHSTT